ncbi:MAG: M28 family peptidase [Saprospiraceae bacterium]
MEKVWVLASRMGKGGYFLNQGGGGITDDHYFVNKIAGIPMIDIINLSGSPDHAFGNHWHTHQDDMSIIDVNTLRAVGQVVTAVVYREDAGNF